MELTRWREKLHLCFLRLWPPSNPQCTGLVCIMHVWGDFEHRCGIWCTPVLLLLYCISVWHCPLLPRPDNGQNPHAKISLQPMITLSLWPNQADSPPAPPSSWTPCRPCWRIPPHREIQLSKNRNRKNAHSKHATFLQETIQLNPTVLQRSEKIPLTSKKKTWSMQQLARTPLVLTCKHYLKISPVAFGYQSSSCYPHTCALPTPLSLIGLNDGHHHCKCHGLL